MWLFLKSIQLVHPCTPHRGGTPLENSGTPWGVQYTRLTSTGLHLWWHGSIEWNKLRQCCVKSKFIAVDSWWCILFTLVFRISALASLFTAVKINQILYQMDSSAETNFHVFIIRLLKSNTSTSFTPKRVSRILKVFLTRILKVFLT